MIRDFYAPLFAFILAVLVVSAYADTLVEDHVIDGPTDTLVTDFRNCPHEYAERYGFDHCRVCGSFRVFVRRPDEIRWGQWKLPKLARRQ
jgi:hypothetical protein